MYTINNTVPLMFWSSMQRKIHM